RWARSVGQWADTEVAFFMTLFRCATALFLLAGCNMVTGADDLTIGRGDHKDRGIVMDGSGGAGGGATVGPGPGAGGMTVGPGAGGDTTSTTTTTTTGADPCVYPVGPYGVAVGQTVPPNITWQ